MENTSDIVLPNTCPGCLSSSLGDQYFFPQRPVILNYRFTTPEEARKVLRKDMRLRECLDCGLIFNEILDMTALNYDRGYENAQNYSPRFVEMCRQTAFDLAAKYDLTKGTVLEVGCGKGDFLKMLCELFGCRGLGYDTSCEIDGPINNGQVTFFQSYVSPSDINESLDLIICRHVIEHVPDIHHFLCLLRDLAEKGGNPVIYVETPAFEWIIQNRAFWDVFYEHCNYFTLTTLSHLVELAGFEVLSQRLIFDGQYQSLELRRAASSGTKPKQTPILSIFAKDIDSTCAELERRLRQAGATEGWAVWGAGAKGVTLANTLSEFPPTCVIDSNPAKQGNFISGTGIPVIAPRELKTYKVPVIFVANPNYLLEINQTLLGMGLAPTLLTH